METKKSVYDIVTDKIIDQLEKGVVPWRKTWNFNGDSFKNIRGNEYSGVNVLLLSMSTMSKGYSSPYWCTYKQAVDLGGHVKKGEKATLVIYWKMLEKDTGKTDENNNPIKKTIPLLRYYNVFNIEQTENIPVNKLPKTETKDINPIESCEQIIKSYKDKPIIDIGKPAYVPCLDKITMPNIQNFEKEEYYYSTLFHELVHSTGAAKRLNRDGVSKIDRFGSEQYSKEELIAEIGACFLCNKTCIENITIENSGAYVQSWLSALNDDKRLIVNASSKAQHAVDYIIS